MSAFAELLGETVEPVGVWPAELPSHLSASQLSMYSRCPEQFRRRYVLGQKERPGAAMVWGSADHFAHEQNFRQKIVSGEDISSDDVQLAFAEGFDQAVERNGGFNEVVWGEDKPGELKDAGTRLVAVYHESVSPIVQPVAVEEKFLVEIPGVPVPVVGYMDVRTGTTAIERKTARAKPQGGRPKPEWRIQGLLYQSVAALPVDWHVSVKTKTPAVYTPAQELGLRLEVSAGMVAVTRSLVANAARMIAATFHEFGPDEPWEGAITHPWACSFCGFQPTCKWWGNSAGRVDEHIETGSAAICGDEVGRTPNSGSSLPVPVPADTSSAGGEASSPSASAAGRLLVPQPSADTLFQIPAAVVDRETGE